MDDPLQPLVALRSKQPEDVHAYLCKLLEVKLGDSSHRISTGQETWLAMLAGLMEFLFFPIPDKAPWVTYKPKIDMLDKATEVIQRICARVDRLFHQDAHILHQLLTRFLDLYCIFDVWVAFEENFADETCTPKILKDHVRSALLKIFSSVGDAVSGLNATPMVWEMLRTFLSQVLDAITDLVTRQAITIPVVIQIPTPGSTTNKKVSEGSFKDKEPLEVKLESSAIFNAFLVLGLEIVTRALSTPILAQVFLRDLIRSTTETIRLVFDFCSSPACFATPKARHQLLNRLVVNAASFYKLNSGFCVPLQVLPYRLLQFRLRHNLKIDLHDAIPYDEAPIPSPEIEILSALELLKGPCQETSKAFIISYLHDNICHVSLAALSAINLAISDVDRELYAAFAADVERRMIALNNEDKDNASRPLIDGVNVTVWTGKIQRLVEEMLIGDDIMWAEEFTSQELIRFVVVRLQRYVEKSWPALETTARISFIKKLVELICLFASGGGVQCSVAQIDSYPEIYKAIFECILEHEVVAEVRRRTYSALSPTSMHLSGKLNATRLEWMIKLALQGMMEKERSTRLSAGKALGALLCMLSSNGVDIEPIFNQLFVHFDNGPLWIKESLLVSVGSIGRGSEPEVIAQALCFLIPQLGNNYPPLKSLAYTQAEAIRQHHNKTIYSLLGHHIDRVAFYLLSRYCTNPVLVTEACRLLAVSTAAFISMTRRKIFPLLFGNCEVKVLESISKELEVSVLGLFAPDSAQILAHIFLFQNNAQTRKALEFVEQVSRQSVDNDPPDVFKLLKICLVPVLGELVATMGEENQEKVARVALKRVEQVLTRKAISGQSSQNNPNVGAFLKKHALGIISYLSDMLQDATLKATLTQKRAILRGMGMMATLIGASVSSVAPQYMSTFQTMLMISELAAVTLDSWYTFLVTLGSDELGPYVGPTTAVLISHWDGFDTLCRELARKMLGYIIHDCGRQLGHHLDDIADLSIVSELTDLVAHLKNLHVQRTDKEQLKTILTRSSSDNIAVAILALRELKTFMSTERRHFIRELASGDVFDPLVSQVITNLLTAACRDGDGAEPLRSLAYELIGALGAADPDRFEIIDNDPTIIVINNFTDDVEAITFTVHIIQDLLVGVFRSTSDVSYQRHLGFALQQLLRVCQFPPALIGGGGSVPVRVRNRWNSFPKHVIETLAPLLDAKYGIASSPTLDIRHPVYSTQSTYREWIQLWTCHLITRASGPLAKSIFVPFFSIVRYKDVVVAYHILPHLVLNILISGDQQDVDDIHQELLTVLKDQVNNDSDSSRDKKLLSAQAVFMILDHLNKWLRRVRQIVDAKKAGNKRARANQINLDAEEQLLRVESILTNIPDSLMATAALQCKAYARSLMNFESQILSLGGPSTPHQDFPVYCERLHEIYSYLDEPDGMEGVSTLILSPSLEYQIRQHESTGRWTSAQSCWEVRLQHSPDNLDFHLGLLRCLRNLGHYDTLRTHVQGVLVRNPEWQEALAGFQVETAWMVGAWDDVQGMVERTNSHSPAIVMARVLLAMRNGDSEKISASLSVARSVLGAPITAAGVKGYKRSYDAVLNLHLLHEIEVIQSGLKVLPQQAHSKALANLVHSLSSRFESTLPAFRTREQILSMRRTALMLSQIPRSVLVGELGRSWLVSAKIARKAGHQQTAYSALLQAKQADPISSFMESAKLVKAAGEPLRAVLELENSMRLLNMLEDDSGPVTSHIHIADEEAKDLKAKAQVLRARWMRESGRYEDNAVFKTFSNAANLRPNWESCQFHLGRFHDECFKNLPLSEQASRGLRMTLYTVRSFSKAIKNGSKYVFQTVPRLLTIWLDFGEDRAIAGSEAFKKINETVSRAIQEAPVYKWYTAFPQIVSRVGHSNLDVYKHLSRLIIRVMEEYPEQALWLFASVAKSQNPNREKRGREILDKLRSNPVNARTKISTLVSECSAMTNELLNLCDCNVDDERRGISMKDFPRLAALGKSSLIIPLQESLNASLPPTSASESVHQPFPVNAPTFEKFFDEIEVMNSLAKPRKITIQGSDGLIYMFLGKPKDDLRKDARLMDFNSIINKLLKANSDSRRRQLHIRTYGVVTLNEECGFIQWVPNTIPIRPVLLKSYDAMAKRGWSNDMQDAFKKIKAAKDQDAAVIFKEKVLGYYPPVFHQWFLETFPEPTAWLTSRLTYGRTAAVMSMVGFILGLGDRHCENILLDKNTGDVVHVDFNCLFEKGKTLEVPERVPFRLTQNVVDGLGVTGVEGVFRIACEITLQLLRDHKDSLMSVLDAFIHDPLVEWEDEKRKLERSSRRNNQNAPNNVRSSVDLRNLAKNALSPIERKLKGVYSPTGGARLDKEISTSNLVQLLIQEATDLVNLDVSRVGTLALAQQLTMSIDRVFFDVDE